MANNPWTVSTPAPWAGSQPQAASGGSAWDNPYWNPGQFQGPGGYDWGDTPYGDAASEQAIDAAWFRRGAEMGVGYGDEAFDRWFRALLPRIKTGYQAASISDPFIRIQPYLRGLGDLAYWQALYQQTTTPDQRGEQWGNYAGPVDWTPR